MITKEFESAICIHQINARQNNRKKKFCKAEIPTKRSKNSPSTFPYRCFNGPLLILFIFWLYHIVFQRLARRPYPWQCREHPQKSQQENLNHNWSGCSKNICWGITGDVIFTMVTSLFSLVTLSTYTLVTLLLSCKSIILYTNLRRWSTAYDVIPFAVTSLTYTYICDAICVAKSNECPK